MTSGFILSGTITAPLAPTLLTPVTGGTVAASGGALTWRFNPTSTGDTPSNADARYRVYGTTTWTTSTGVDPLGASQWNVISLFTAGTAYEWQIRTYGSTALVSPWSSSFFFTATAPLAAPTITSPATGSTPLTTPVTVTWTLPTGFPQAAYRVRRTDSTAGTVIYYDSGIIYSTALTAAVPLDAVTRTDHLQVQFESSGTWSAWADITINLTLNPPPTPLLSAVCNPSTATVTVQITNPAPAAGQSPAISNDLFRTDPAGNTIRLATGLTTNCFYTDPWPAAGVNTYSAAAYSVAGVQAIGTLDHLGTEAASLDGIGVLYTTLANVR